MSNWFSSWSAQVQAPSGSTSTSPALAAFDGKLYVAWKGKDTDQRLFVSSSADGVNWSAQVQAPSGSTSTSPALAAFDGKLYVAWKGKDTDQRLFVSSSADGVNWSAQVQAPSGSTSTSPALAAFDGKLYVAWKGKDTDQRLFVSSSADGVNWSAQVQAPSGSTSTSPALAAFNGKLYAAWKGANTDQSLYLSASADGVNWSAQVQAPSGSTSTSPALAAFNGKLYAAWKGKDTDQSLYLSASADGVNWSPQAQAPHGHTSTSPALAAFNARLYAAWKGEDNDQRLFVSSSPDPVPVPPLVIRIVNMTNNGTTFAWDAFSHSTLQSLTMYIGEHEGVLNWGTHRPVTDTSYTADLIPPYYDVWYTLQAITIYGETQVSNSINVQYPVPPPPSVTVPDVIGMVYADAVTKLQGVGLQVGETSVTGIFNTSNYKVTGQSPAGGTQVNSGSLVNLTIEAITPPSTGTYDLALKQESPNSFNYSAPVIAASGQLGGVPADATITEVTSLSSATFSLAHGGPGSHYVPLGANASTTDFNGQKVTVDPWSAEYSGAIAQAPASLRVAIAWKG